MPRKGSGPGEIGPEKKPKAPLCGYSPPERRELVCERRHWPGQGCHRAPVPGQGDPRALPRMWYERTVDGELRVHDAGLELGSELLRSHSSISACA
jgi:hypothetical protein